MTSEKDHLVQDMLDVFCCQDFMLAHDRSAGLVEFKQRSYFKSVRDIEGFWLFSANSVSFVVSNGSSLTS